MNREEIWNILENRILPLVQKPGRYTGGEINEVNKDLKTIDVRLALVFPDVYEIGMSNQGLKVLYEIVNNTPRFYAERVFSPWIDMEEYIRKFKVPMFSTETHSPLTEFDLIGFSLHYELCYTNMLNILNLSGIPLYAEERLNGDYPLVIAGGPCVFVPEPIAPFIDMFIVGDGEEAILEILKAYREWKSKDRTDKKEFLRLALENVQGVYIPCFGPSNKVKKRVADKIYLPVRPIVPLIEIVHDRITLEIMRGCPRRCRFCQAGVLHKPVRRHTKKSILDTARECIKNTGYETLCLGSLSSMDYAGIEGLVSDMCGELKGRKISISLPSMRVDSFSLNVINRISGIKKTGITLAPEAASDKLLNVINKGYGETDIIKVVKEARSLGYRLIKLYFMIGLPGEDYSDLDKMVSVLKELGRIVELNVSIGTLIPKAHTAFQWHSMLTLDEIYARQKYVRSRIGNNRIKINFHKPEQTILEAVFSRGDKGLAGVLYRAWQLGARFDEWDECFRFDIWSSAFSDCGINMEKYLAGKDYNEPLAWDHIDAGVEKEALVKESQKAILEVTKVREG